MAEDEKTRPEETAAEAEMRFIEAGSLDMENRDPKNLNSHIAVSELRSCLFRIFTKRESVRSARSIYEDSLLVFADSLTYLNGHSSKSQLQKLNLYNL